MFVVLQQLTLGKRYCITEVPLVYNVSYLFFTISSIVVQSDRELRNI